MAKDILKIFAVVCLVLIGTIFIFQTTNAALVPCGRTTGTPEETRPCTTCDFFQLTNNVFNFALFYVVPAVATLLFLAAGFLILLGGAVPSQVAQGRAMFRTTVIGLFIIFGAWMITNTILKSLAGDNDVSRSWYKIECSAPAISNTSTTASSSAVQGPAAPSSGATCKFSGVNLCEPNSASCPSNTCSQYSKAINEAANSTPIGGTISAALIRAIMYNESSCNVSAQNSSSCGLMQLQPATANLFKYQCGVSASITCDWLRDPANAAASICIGAKFLQSIAGGACGTDVRNIAAGYNGGIGACGESRDCSGDKSCNDTTVKRWECLYDDPQHTVCNTGFDETRNYAPKVLACYLHQ